MSSVSIRMLGLLIRYENFILPAVYIFTCSLLNGLRIVVPLAPLCWIPQLIPVLQSRVASGRSPTSAAALIEDSRLGGVLRCFLDTLPLPFERCGLAQADDRSARHTGLWPPCGILCMLARRTFHHLRSPHRSSLVSFGTRDASRMGFPMGSPTAAGRSVANILYRLGGYLHAVSVVTGVGIPWLNRDTWGTL